MKAFFSKSKDVETLAKYHEKINSTYLKDIKIRCEFKEIEISKFWAFAYGKENKIEYDKRCLRDLYDVCLHEFTHLIQYKYLKYTEHDLEFCLIFNILVFKEQSLNQVFIQYYDIADDAIALRTAIVFNSFKSIVTHLALMPFEQAVRAVPRWANHLRGGMPNAGADLGDPIELPTPDELAQALR